MEHLILSEWLVPRETDNFVSRGRDEGNIEILGETKLTVSRVAMQSLCDLLNSWNFEAGNSLNLTVTAVVGQLSRVTVHSYPLTS